MNWWTIVRLVVRACRYIIGLAHLRLRRKRSQQHDTVPCTDVILSENPMCVESVIASADGRVLVRSRAGGYLLVFECSCFPPRSWLLASHEEGSFCAVAGCRSCGAIGRITEPPSTDASSRKAVRT